MAALVQSYPQQSGTVTMLQSRPASATAMLPQSQSQGPQQYGGSQQRNNFYANPNTVGQMPYRGNPAPIQPYAFTSTPSLTPAAQWQQFRALSSPAVPNVHSMDPNNRARYPASASMTNLPTTASMGYAAGSRDDSSLMGQRRVSANPRPQSAYMAGSATTATATQVSFTQATPIKISPDRYRRPSPRVVDVAAPSQQARTQASAQPSGSGMAAVAHLYGLQEQKASAARAAAAANRPNSAYGQRPSSAVDDISLNRHDAHEEAKRFRRRSMPTLDSAEYPPLSQLPSQRAAEANNSQSARPKSAEKEHRTGRLAVPGASAAPAMHGRNNSSDSLASSRSSHSRPSSSANRNAAPTGNPAHLPTTPDQTGANQDYPKLVNIPPRSSSSDAINRVVSPSPLSKPVSMAGESEAAGQPAAASSAAALSSPPATPQANAGGNDAKSPAVQQLAAISAKGGKLRSKTSRLRRAFSFGSAQEFKNAGKTENGDTQTAAAGPSKLHKEPTAEELYDAEQARIAQKQEAGGIGNSIYAGARIFSGSTDNLSISSTASSASIMIRKMGRGMKKGGRSIAGIFRPKSVIGVAPADGPVSQTSTSEAAVSMITVEAERERVNVNADPHSQQGGGTGYPRLERNSIDAAKAGSTERVGSSGTDNSGARKSIVGGERERAEVLAAVRKGILKRRDSPSPVRQNGAPAFELPQIPSMTDSPGSSAPSTPNDEAQGHKRTGSVAIGSEDYFMTALRLRQDTKSAPNTPQGSLKRNATFSPRIVFHDTWPGSEYDRRGEIATCNRLTPMLAQQIKEELNSFKMEMEVHENSKIYTHFF